MAERGRPSLYTIEIAEEICARLASGESLRSICRDENMPSERTVRTWADENPEFSPHYAKARDLGVDAIAEEALEIADDGSNDWIERHDPENPGYQANGEHIQRSRLRVDTRKWYASKIAPKRYGDRVVTEHTGADGGPIRTEEVTNVKELARRVALMLTKAEKQT